MNYLKPVLTTTFLCFFLLSGYANVRLPKLVGDHMVLQRDAKLPVWGWADKGEKVTVTFQGKSYPAKPGADGKWMVTLPAMPAGGPYQMTIKGKNTLTIQDILVGDVWMGSGQSNMEWNLSSTVNNFKKEIADANFPNIRLFDVKNTVALTPQQDIPSDGWKICSPETIGSFSAVAYFFGRDLYQQYDVPIGLITTDWGGTPVEAWISGSALKTFPEYKATVEGMENDKSDLAKQLSEYTAKRTAWEKEFAAVDRGYQAGGKTWADADVETGSWPTMEVPGLWEQPDVLPDFDGIVWFRKVIDVPAEAAGKPLILHLGTIDDADTTWFNGVKVGSTNGYNMPRDYTVPGNLVKAGRNIITVRVVDTGGGGGIWGGADEMTASAGGTTLPLAGKWSYQTAYDVRTMPKAPPVAFQRQFADDALQWNDFAAGTIRHQGRYLVPGRKQRRARLPIPRTFPRDDQRLAATLGV
jgi:sialate O-acetylesterase